MAWLSTINEVPNMNKSMIGACVWEWNKPGYCRFPFSEALRGDPFISLTSRICSNKSKSAVISTAFLLNSKTTTSFW
jgi:hypothetical protein